MLFVRTHTIYNFTQFLDNNLSFQRRSYFLKIKQPNKKYGKRKIAFCT